MSPPSPSSDHQPRQIGPYRLGERLGRGGMGEVYRGYDARLDRPVALKRVRPGVGNHEMALRRFQREARAAARLRHPAIVQVHDWVDAEDDGAWLVMELVEGRSLRDIVHEGPLAPARVVALAHDLLEGLAVAHDAGLIHRDLKAENVMVSSVSSAGRGRGEQARILDFGLAKRAMPEAGETQLSEEGKIVGTLSALAPEQVLGQPVDHRADLFALGSMLYELLVGKQAFVGSHPGETLNRICTARQIPVRTLRPDVSVSLSTFVDRLLEKDPRRRPATADEALDLLDRVSTDSLDGSLATRTADGLATALDTPAAPVDARVMEHSTDGLPRRAPALDRRKLGLVVLVVAIAIGGLVAAYRFLPSAKVEEPLYVAVAKTRVEAPESRNLHLAAETIQSAAIHGLTRFRDVFALEVAEDSADADDPKDLVEAMAGNELLQPLLRCDARACRLELRRLGAEGQVLESASFPVDASQLLDLDRAIVSQMQALFQDRRLKVGAAELDVRPEDYRAFVELREQFEQREPGLALADTLAALDGLTQSSPRFVEAWLFEALVSQRRFQEEREVEFLDRARDAVRRAREIAPQDSRVATQDARIELVAGNLDEAARILDQLLGREPGNARTLFLKALVLEEQGSIDPAIEMAGRAVERLPSAGLHFDLADLLYRNGRVDDARMALETGLERNPKSYDGLSRLAQLELMSGSADRAVALYNDLVARSPEPTELTNLGTAYLLQGDYESAARSFEEVVDMAPSSPFATLNLADVLTLVGRDAEAEALYRKLLEQIAADPDPLRLVSLQAQALARIGQPEEAVEAVQLALSQRPDHPWLAYEIALVHVLIGDRSSALWNARRARDGGVDERWFSLPWFDPIRTALAG